MSDQIYITVNSYQDLIVWQKSIDLVEKIFRITEQFPKSELYGLVSQMRRAAIAIPSNIAEGAGRQHTKEFIQFLGIAEGSATELETQLIIAERLQFLTKSEYDQIAALQLEIFKMLRVLIKKLSMKE